MKFKKGDTVRLVRHGKIGWEGCYFTKDQLTLNKIYTVVSVGYDTDHYKSRIAVPQDRTLLHSPNSYHPDHFALIKLTNEERMQRRMEELHEV